MPDRLFGLLAIVAVLALFLVAQWVLSGGRQGSRADAGYRFEWEAPAPRRPLETQGS